MIEKAYYFIPIVLLSWIIGCGDDETEDADGDTATETSGTDDSPGDSESDSGSAQGSDSEPAPLDTVTATIRVPEDFDGVPVLLGGVFYAADSEGGMPDGFGDSVASPDITPGGSIVYTTTQAGLEGDFYLSLVLYCENGGAGQFPVPGVDWIAGVETPLSLGPGTGAVDAGEMTLFLAPAK